jgi:hypothetical protein
LVWDSTGSHIANETSVTLSRFRASQDGKSSIFVVYLGGSFFASNKGAENETLEKGNSSKKA